MEKQYLYDTLGDRCTEHFLTWLIRNGYFECPASAGHHGNYAGGLYEHSKLAAEVLADLTEKLDLTWDKPESPFVVGLLHDVCKMDDYVWVDKDTIKYSPTLPGHGSKSVIMLAGNFKLTEEEKMCIFFHMGAYGSDEERKHFSNTVNKYPNVLYAHTADMIASQIKGI